MSDPLDLSRTPNPTVAQLMTAIDAATVPSRVDWYVAPWPASDPAAQKTQAIDREAKAFHARFAGGPPRRKRGDDGDAPESVGRWLNDTITNSPIINDKKDHTRLWDGARRSLAARAEELVEMAHSVAFFRERYQTDLTFTGHAIDDLRSRIEKRLSDARSDSVFFPALTTMAGMMFMGVGGAIAGRDRLKEGAGKTLLTLGIVGGAVGGWASGGMVSDLIHGVGGLTDDLSRLKALREKQSVLAMEGVKATTIDGVVRVVAEYENEERLGMDKDRRRTMEERLTRKLKEVVGDNSYKRGSVAPSQGPWGQIGPMLAAAIAARDANKVVEVWAVSCDIGNTLRRGMTAAAAARTTSLMEGWAGGRFDDPFAAPDSTWL